MTGTQTSRVARGGRLALRIYLVSFFEIALITVAFVLLRRYVLEPPWKSFMVQRAR